MKRVCRSNLQSAMQQTQHILIRARYNALRPSQVFLVGVLLCESRGVLAIGMKVHASPVCRASKVDLQSAAHP